MVDCALGFDGSLWATERSHALFLAVLQDFGGAAIHAVDGGHAGLEGRVVMIHSHWNPASDSNGAEK